MSTAQPQFSGTIPDNYERYLEPILFRPYANSMAVRVKELHPSRVLELACGTGSVTRRLISVLPAESRIVATDLSEDMLQTARQNRGDSATIMWRVADGCSLPFADGSFDVIVCQFGVMSFPDKACALAEAFRVLSPSGHLLYSAWGELSSNPVFRCTEETLAAMFPGEETPFMPTPVSMADPDLHRELLKSAGFGSVQITIESHDVGPHDPAGLASGFAFGTPLGPYLMGQGYDLDKVRSALTADFAAELGDPMFCTLTAIVCHATKA